MDFDYIIKAIILSAIVFGISGYMIGYTIWKDGKP